MKKPPAFIYVFGGISIGHFFNILLNVYLLIFI